MNPFTSKLSLHIDWNSLAPVPGPFVRRSEVMTAGTELEAAGIVNLPANGPLQSLLSFVYQPPGTIFNLLVENIGSNPLTVGLTVGANNEAQAGTFQMNPGGKILLWNVQAAAYGQAAPATNVLDWTVQSASGTQIAVSYTSD